MKEREMEDQKASIDVSAQGVLSARVRMGQNARRTPLEVSHVLSQIIGGDVRIKMENLQHTGSFKFRGALNVMSLLTDDERKSGVIAPTAGNHGLGLSAAGKVEGVPVHIYLPRAADPSKVAAMTANGARITYFDDIEDARLAALAKAEESGLKFVSAYNEPAMVNAAGTVGLEILEDMPDVDVILACTGGGGLVSGIATIAQSLAPKTEVWGVQSENSPTFAEWLKADRAAPLDLKPSIAEGISGTIEPETITFPLIQERVARMATISEAEIAEAMLWMLEHHAHVIEPSGAAGVAGALRYKADLKNKKVAVVVTGRNVAASRYRSILDGVNG